MTEFRKDPLADHWVILAPERANRPEQYASGAAGGVPSRCPFCGGNEKDTPPAVACFDTNGVCADDASWLVRVVPNKYPAVLDTGLPQPPHEDFFQAIPGIGVHEVLIESPEHITDYTELGEQQVGLVFLAYQARLRAMRADHRLAYCQVFKNSGEAAGASLEHSHSQLIATPIVPTQVQGELAKSHDYYQHNGHCVFCEMLQRELNTQTRLVAQTPHFVAFCPFASQFPYEVWILPRRHSSNFEDEEGEVITEAACLVKDVVGRVESALSKPAFNYLIHTAPLHESALLHYHWHLEIFPRLTKTAGFEWGAGDYINTVSPEDAARILRSAV